MIEPTDRRIDKLIRLLVNHATVVVPSPKIADEIGVPRRRVRTWIDTLRAAGVDIQGHLGKGYQLRALPDVLAPSLIQAELGDCEIGKQILHFFTVDSTSSVALHVADEGAAHGTVVVAEGQTAGRGRFGRNWYSEKGSGIYVSIILRPPLTPASAPVLTLMAGLAVHQTVEEITRVTPDIRWPNDVLLRGKKVGGILTEMSAEMDRIHAVVLGIGLNVNNGEIPAALRDTATSLRIESGRTWSRIHLLAGMLANIERTYHLLLEKGSAAIARAWEEKSSFARGKRVSVKTEAGQSRAITEGLEDSGALRLRFADGRAASLVSGEVFEIR